MESFTPTTVDELVRFVRETAPGNEQCLCPVGGGTSLHYGQPLDRPCIKVKLGSLDDVIEHAVDDMTIRVGAGMRVDRLQETLAAHHQFLPVDIAESERATVGGALATNTYGPGCFRYGTLRDYVIGIEAVDGRGRRFHSGGRVVKNVAGYDLAKLLIGSQGTLAVITQVTFKVLPRPPVRRLMWCPAESLKVADHVLEGLLTSQARPAAVDLLNPKAVWQVRQSSRLDVPTDQPVLCLGFAGTAATVEWEMGRVEGELQSGGIGTAVRLDGEQSERLWQALTEFQVASDDPATLAVSLRPSRVTEWMEAADSYEIAVQAHAPRGKIIGHLPDDATSPQEVARIVSALRTLAEEGEGALTVAQCERSLLDGLDVYGSPQPSWGVMARIKQALDPDGILSPGRVPWEPGHLPAPR